MNMYLAVKSVVILTALSAAFGLFYVRVRRLYRLMISVRGFFLTTPVERVF